MKYLFLVLISIISFKSLSSDKFIEADRLKDRNIYLAKNEAIKMILAYQNNPLIKQSDFHFNLAKSIISNLNSNVDIFIENNSNTSDHCYDSLTGDETWGFVSEIPNVIYLCRFISRIKNSINKIAQIIIHESYHIWENNNNVPSSEVSAGEFEADVTMVAIRCIPLKSYRTVEAINILNKRNARFCDDLN